MHMRPQPAQLRSSRETSVQRAIGPVPQKSCPGGHTHTPKVQV
jgi:hypothetical protein